MLRSLEMWPFRRPKPPEPANLRHCSFCGKRQDEVRKLIAGPTIYICDECIDLCNDIIAEEVEQDRKLKRAATPIASLNAPSWCCVCRLAKSPDEVVAVSELGFVCRPCVDKIRAATSEPAPR